MLTYADVWVKMSLLCQKSGLNLRIPKSEQVVVNMLGLKLDQWLLLLSERERSFIESQFCLELLLSVGAILFMADKATGKYIQARSQGRHASQAISALSRNVDSSLQRGFLSMNSEEKRSKRCISRVENTRRGAFQE